MDIQIYKEHGYPDRISYLIGLSEEYCVNKETVFSLAELLGENEDFDGLILALADACILF